MNNFSPTIHIKPYISFFLKTYRKNVLENKNFPDSPADGWFLPDNWFSRINDLVRKLIEVKYLDGVEFLIGEIKELCNDLSFGFEYHLEARDEGYYAAHVYIPIRFEIPKITWDTEIVEPKVEIQITTQLQEVIRQLLHEHYERKRSTTERKQDWQWDYKSNEFAANYLGHILHYLEGIIVEVRDVQQKKENIQ